ncbi:SAV_6107 family HEPN domain-containing protein [Corynebacterium confusum]|uniref:SAV_6107 family HEPN domain-containing protein n=1 Tax=uncultured Corynebacterium sp. TaxID=159447 RepID=UPI0025D9625D|nr:SAV_6107 family HEPN domain-containing protein [uncultured Corynebacterium sp.]
MAHVISATRQATTRASRTSGVGKQQHFLRQARMLIEQAREYAADGRFEEALEVAYQAGLRTAGARIAVSMVARRKRKPSSAWEQLALVSAEGKEWAQEFGQYSKLRSRVSLGLEDGVEEDAVFELMGLAARFMAATHAAAVESDFAA